MLRTSMCTKDKYFKYMHLYLFFIEKASTRIYQSYTTTMSGNDRIWSLMYELQNKPLKCYKIIPVACHQANNNTAKQHTLVQMSPFT